MTRELTDEMRNSPYGTVWCPHRVRVMVPDPADSTPYPASVPVDPWPCTECTLAELEAAAEAEAAEYEVSGQELDALRASQEYW